MGKVRDEAPAKASKPASKGTAMRDARRRVAPFFANLVRTEPFKPTQGKNARLWTAVGLGGLIAAGIYRLYVTLLADQYTPAVRFGIPAVLGAAMAWAIWRVIQYPPFADFLIATEAEMNKVSWTTKADLQRATSVVLVTVLLMATFLFGVDWLWSNLLQVIGVLRFDGGGAFGSQAG